MRRLYWVKEGLKVAGFIFGATALYSLFMALLNTDEDPLQSFFQQGTTYFAIMGVLMSLLNNMSAHQTIIPISLSFGGTRKEALWGIQLYRLTVLIFLLAGAFVMFGLMLSDISILFRAIPIMIGTYLFFAGLGGLMGTFVSRISKGVLGVIVGFATLLVMFILIFAILGLDIGLEISDYIPWLIFIPGAAVYGICSFFEVRSIRRHYVR